MCRVCEGLERVRLFVDDIVCFSKNSHEHISDFRKFFERLTTFDLKLAPKKAHPGEQVVIFLGHRVTAEGIAPDPRKVEELTKMPMSSNVGQLHSLLEAMRYYRILLPKIAAETKSLQSLSKKGVKFDFTLEHIQIVQTLSEQLSSPKVLAFPDLAAAISGDRPFHLITGASADGLGAVIEQDQSDGTIRPIGFLSRSTLPNQKNWSATELGCAAIVWAVKQNRKLFYGTPYIVVSDHQPLKNSRVWPRKSTEYRGGLIF